MIFIQKSLLFESRQMVNFRSTKDVVNTNLCEIAIRIVGTRAVILSSIDNLIKGASGQAVQNMNIMYGFNETTGLL
jgi:N-acetyl-gamma-glutamyl-phosphate reductase